MKTEIEAKKAEATARPWDIVNTNQGFMVRMPWNGTVKEWKAGHLVAEHKTSTRYGGSFNKQEDAELCVQAVNEREKLLADRAALLAALQSIHAALNQPVQFTSHNSIKVRAAASDILRLDAKMARETAAAAIAQATGPDSEDLADLMREHPAFKEGCV